MAIITVLGLKDLNNAEVLVASDFYVRCMTDNPHFTDAETVSVLTSVKKATSDLRSIMNAPLSEDKVQLVAKARIALDSYLNILAGRVEAKANDPSLTTPDALAIVESAGMMVKNKAKRSSTIFSAANTDISGEVMLKAPGGSRAYEWSYLLDGSDMKNLVIDRSTTRSSTKISGLEPGKKYAFYYRPVQSDEPSKWLGPALLIVT
jgi:hypothetical protein